MELKPELLQRTESGRKNGIRFPLYEKWSRAREFLYGLKVACVSVASVTLGGLLYFVAPQVQDLFLEVSDNPARSLGFWLLFYLSVLVAWACSVYVSSRWILSRFEQGAVAGTFPDIRPVPTWVRRWLPPLLAVNCFVAVIVGQVMALINSPTRVIFISEIFVSNSDPRWWVTVLEDLTGLGAQAADAIGPGIVILIIYGSLVALFLWFSLRGWFNSWSSKARRISAKIVWWLVTIVLGIPVLFAFVSLALFTIQEGTTTLGLGHLAILPPLTAGAAYLAWRGLKPNRDYTATPIGAYALRLRGISEIADEATATREIVVPLYYITLVASLSLMAIMIASNPVYLTQYVYRAPLLPIILGVFVAPLTYLSSWSVRVRAPLLLLSVLIGAVFALIRGETNDIRTIPATASRDTLQKAVNRWAEVNGCDLTTKENARDCPSPFIISVAGGASRSAFHLAGVIGQLMDDKSFSVEEGHESPTFSPDGSRLIIVASNDKTPWLWDATAAGKKMAALKSHRGAAPTASFSPDGARIVTIAHAESTAWLWNGTTGQWIADLKGHGGSLTSVVFSSDGARLVTIANKDKIAWLWDLKTGREIAPLIGHERAVRSATFSPDGTRLVTFGYGDKIPQLWDTSTGQRIPISNLGDQAHAGAVVNASFSRDGMFVTVAERDKSAQLWDATTGRWIATLTGDQGFLASASFSPNGTRIVTEAYEANTAWLWNGKTGDKIAPLKGHDQPLRSVIFSPDGARIVTIAVADKILRLWNGTTGAEIASLAGHTGNVKSAVFSPDGTRILTTAWVADLLHPDTIAWLWNAETGAAIARLEGHKDVVREASFSPDGTRIVTIAFEDRVARLWDGNNGKLIIELRKHESALDNAIFSRDSARIVTLGQQDKAAWLWDGKSGQEIAPLEGHQRRLQHVYLSPDGARIVTTSDDKTMGIWDGQNGNQLVLMKSFTESILMQPFAKQLFAVSAVSGGALGAIVTYAALADSQRRDSANGIGNPPCKQDVPDRDWYAPYARVDGPGRSPARAERAEAPSTISPLEVQKSWRGCLQLLVAGDFISPVFISFIRGDRAVVLEQAWEARYARLTGQDEIESTMAKPLVALRRDTLEDDKSWLPILLFNGTSVTTGRRIVTTDVDTLTWSHGRVTERLFRDAYDLHELLAYSVEAGDQSHTSESSAVDRDVRLSTSVTMSARFPIISPHGSIRDADGEVIDRVVDGGYFENFGASTAQELVGALEAFGLKPFVVVVNNEPTTSGIECIRPNSVLAYPKAPRAPWFALLSSPPTAMLATRQARGSLAAANLCSWISDRERFAFITVSPDRTDLNKALSMNWWLSKNVQKYLDDQIDAKLDIYMAAENAAEFKKIRAARKLQKL